MYLQIGPLVLQLPQGWTFEYPEQSPIEGSGPNGDTALISFSQANATASETELAAHFAAMREQVMLLMLAVAQERGSVVREPTLLSDAHGRLLYSAASAGRRDSSLVYFIQYTLLTTKTQHYFDFAGRGPVAAATTHWDRIMLEADWQSNAPSTAR